MESKNMFEPPTNTYSFSSFQTFAQKTSNRFKSSNQDKEFLVGPGIPQCAKAPWCTHSNMAFRRLWAHLDPNSTPNSRSLHSRTGTKVTANVPSEILGCQSKCVHQWYMSKYVKQYVRMTQNVCLPRRMSKHLSDHMSECVSGRTPEAMSESMPVRIVEYMSERKNVSSKPYRMSDSMPEISRNNIAWQNAR